MNTPTPGAPAADKARACALLCAPLVAAIVAATAPGAHHQPRRRRP